MSRFVAATLALTTAAMPLTLSAQSKLQYDVPKGWTSQPPSSGMRQAQFVLPRAEGDPVDATAVVFYFGQSEGGGVEENLDRWAGQMVQPDGQPGTRKQARTSVLTVNGLKVSTLDLAGTYAGGMGAAASNMTNARMKAAVVETPGGSFFVRVLGPVKTMARWEAAIDQFFKSVRY
jgi:hypothetical protein